MEMGLAGNWFRRFLSLVEYLSGYIQALLEDLLPRRRGSWIFQRIESDSWSSRGTIQLVYLHVSPSRRRKFIQHFETRWGELYKSAIDRVRILARVLFSKHYCISPVQVKFYLPRNTNFLSFPANEIFRYVPTYFHHFFYPSFLPFFLEENRIWIFIDGARVKIPFPRRERPFIHRINIGRDKIITPRQSRSNERTKERRIRCLSANILFLQIPFKKL